jgi:cytochrome c peroxidase
MNPLRSTLTKSRLNARTLFASGSVLGATSRVGGGVRQSIMQGRGYASESTPKKGGSGGIVFLSKFS